jgi:hypothetical protein
MQILRWLGRKLSQSDDLGLPGSDADECVSVIHEEIDRKKYDKARDLLLRAVKHRDKIEDPAIANYLLTSLEATWHSPIPLRSRASGIDRFSLCFRVVGYIAVS